MAYVAAINAGLELDGALDHSAPAVFRPAVLELSNVGRNRRPVFAGVGLARVDGAGVSPVGVEVGRINRHLNLHFSGGVSSLRLQSDSLVTTSEHPFF